MGGRAQDGALKLLPSTGVASGGRRITSAVFVTHKVSRSERPRYVSF